MTLDAGKDVTVKGADLSAAQDLTLMGQNLNLDPGTDATQNSTSQSASQFGVTLALGGVAGNAAATVDQSLNSASHADDSLLAALDKGEAALAAYSGIKNGIADARSIANGNPQRIRKGLLMFERPIFR